MTKHTLAARMLEARTSAGLNQRDVAYALDTSESTIRRWEHGLNAPNAQQLPTLASVLGVSLDWLFGLTDDGPAPPNRSPKGGRRTRRN